MVGVIRRQADRKRFELVIDHYLRACFARRAVVRVSELADLLGVPRSYLSRVILRLFGRQLLVILREKQLEEATRLLRHVSPLTIDEIAAACGFGHRSTLFRHFRNAFGMTPAAFRTKFGK